MSAEAVVATVVDVLAPYFTDPTFLMTTIIAGSILLSLMGRLPWKTTGLVLLIGAVYAKLAQTYDPEVAVTIIVSNVVSYTVGQFVSTLRQKFIVKSMDEAFREE